MSFFEKYFLRSGFEVTGSLFTVVNLMLIASGYLLFFSVPTLSFPWAPSLLSTASSKNPCWIDSIAFLYLDAAPRAAFTYSNSIPYNRTYTGNIISLPLHNDLILNTAYFGTDADHNCQIPSFWRRLLISSVLSFT